VNYTRWTNDDVALLKRLVSQGLQTKEIAASLKRKASAVQTKKYDLKLKTPPIPEITTTLLRDRWQQLLPKLKQQLHDELAQ